MSRKAGEKRVAFTQQRSFLFGQQREGGLSEPLSQRDRVLLPPPRPCSTIFKRQLSIRSKRKAEPVGNASGTSYRVDPVLIVEDATRE